MKLSPNALEGRLLWIKPDRDKSRIAFNPRRAIIVRVFERPQEKEDVLVRLVPPAFVWRPIPHRMTHTLLRFIHEGDDSIQMMFRIGLSAAVVYEPNQKIIDAEIVPEQGSLSRLGIATITPWPIPSAAEIRENIAAEK